MQSILYYEEQLLFTIENRCDQILMETFFFSFFFPSMTTLNQELQKQIQFQKALARNVDFTGDIIDK